MNDLIEVEGRWYIRATSALADDRTRVLKHGESFCIFDRTGDIQPIGHGKQGLFHQDTRYLSRMQLRIDGLRPLLLSSAVTRSNTMLVVDLANPDLGSSEHVRVKRETVHLLRSKFLWDGGCFENVRVTNHGHEEIEIDLSFEYGADFIDIFEVRGAHRERRGKTLPAEVGEKDVRLTYQGLDSLRRGTHLTFDRTPEVIDAHSALFHLRLAPHESTQIRLTATCEAGEPRAAIEYDQALLRLERESIAAREPYARIVTSNQQFNAWLECSVADLQMMTTETRRGPYPFAGVPWFSTPFGRDAIITALQVLWINPSLSRGVLRFLAGMQADAIDDHNDAEPGKILHEARRGEMAALREVPFGRYYGSIDSTPLFVMLAGEYFTETADGALIEELWPHVQRALAWMDRWGDIDGDGFIEYQRRAHTGLVQQGWKDSDDSVFYDDGELAEQPIALCEVQGYAYAAKRSASMMARYLGQDSSAERLLEEAELLKRRFDEAFWLDELGTYALALDGKKKPCRVRSSNAGHVLFTGLALKERAKRVGEVLLAEDMFSGWGVRTLSSLEKRYNPLSYHNGSIWPHDNSLIAEGLARYGLREQAAKILEGLFEASLFLDLHRMPELFCGISRRPGSGPTLYPVACAPQAWASGAPFLLLRSILGLRLDAHQHRVTFERPVLPPWLDDVKITNLRAGSSALDLTIHRYTDDVGINVRRRSGPCEVVVVK